VDLAEIDLRNKVDYMDKAYIDLNVLRDWINRYRLLWLTISTSFANIVDDDPDCENEYDPKYKISDVVVTWGTPTSICRCCASLTIWIVV